ncbi:unnamed protein product [Paramecium pentaurelia]|uniref:MORN repeat-containing protein 3 n=1 Tax=Paramecium pentaurelia TaxID=43138 RepID=A0A8S1TZ31_9CILI|nr:unnamed protein product [Paramecium pentaurelia]
MDALNESFQQLHFKKEKSSNFLSQLYDQENEGLVPIFKFEFRRNQLNFTQKLYDFQMLQFLRDPLIDPDLKSYLRNFNIDDKNSIYLGNKFDGKKHGLGLSRINQNHLKFGIFSLDQIKWGWEIILKKNNFISFYKGYFLNEQKDGIGIQRQYNFQGLDPNEIDEYVGKFSKDKRDGEGIYKNFGLKIVKKGEFKDDKLNGLVNIYENYDDIIFIGYFKNDKKHGFGKVINSKDNYEILGDYYEDQQTGEHKKLYQDGRTETITYPSKLCSIF